MTIHRGGTGESASLPALSCTLRRLDRELLRRTGRTLIYRCEAKILWMPSGLLTFLALIVARPFGRSALADTS
jgi:hypothetical protein